jgi:leucyl aminopeptidase
MHPQLTQKISAQDVPIVLISEAQFSAWEKKQSNATRNWLKLQSFEAKPGSICQIPATSGVLEKVLLGVHPQFNLWNFAALAEQLPAQHTYFLEDTKLKPALIQEALLGWMLGCYRYTAYKPLTRNFPLLRIPAKAHAEAAYQMAQAICLTRELINRPANDLTPSALAKAAKKLAKAAGATYTEISGKELLKKNYPTIHAVGRACEDAPRLVDIRWNQEQTKLPLVTLVGKGVCFDTGGLNIKTGNGMGLMKKDMGGAAAALGLAQLLMQTGLKLRLRVLLPIVENSIAGNAFRPQDIIRTRKGLTVEIGNTDAEGRLILCDALTEADSEKPDLLIDMATLTGASRVALGLDIPSFFTPSDALAQEVITAAAATSDPLWRLPLWEGYEEYLNSQVADTNNAGSSSYAGAITAALFLKKFVTETPNWLHIDMMAWNISAKAGRPVGGEAQGLRAIYHLLQQRYAETT